MQEAGSAEAYPEGRSQIELDAELSRLLQPRRVQLLLLQLTVPAWDAHELERVVDQQTKQRLYE